MDKRSAYFRISLLCFVLALPIVADAAEEFSCSETEGAKLGLSRMSEDLSTKMAEALNRFQNYTVGKAGDLKAFYSSTPASEALTQIRYIIEKNIDHQGIAIASDYLTRLAEAKTENDEKGVLLSIQDFMSRKHESGRHDAAFIREAHRKFVAESPIARNLRPDVKAALAGFSDPVYYCDKRSVSVSVALMAHLQMGAGYSFCHSSSGREWIDGTLSPGIGVAAIGLSASFEHLEDHRVELDVEDPSVVGSYLGSVRLTTTDVGSFFLAGNHFENDWEQRVPCSLNNESIGGGMCSWGSKNRGFELGLRVGGMIEPDLGGVVANLQRKMIVLGTNNERLVENYFPEKIRRDRSETRVAPNRGLAEVEKRIESRDRFCKAVSEREMKTGAGIPVESQAGSSVPAIGAGQR